ncbi:MAG: hypothetical protein LAT84_09515 [Balneolia bacterium]|nr:hypothetical protein [Balneolia bacterium]
MAKAQRQWIELPVDELRDEKSWIILKIQQIMVIPFDNLTTSSKAGSG